MTDSHGSGNRGQTVIGIAWFTRDQWDLLLQHAADRPDLEDTYEEWQEGANRLMQWLRSEGYEPHEVAVDVLELVAWCEARGVVLDGKARSQFATERLRDVYGP